MKLKIALIQINSGADIAANIAVLEKMVESAAAQGAQLTALPENVFQMNEPTGCGKRTLFTQDTHPGILATETLAKKYKLWILIGSAAVKIDESGKAVNRSLLINDSGKIVSLYDKIHLFDAEPAAGERYAESDRMLPGRQAVLAETPWGKLGITICYDVRFPHLFRTLAKAGAQIIAVPAAFAQTTGEAHWHVLLRARAIENGCFIIAPAQCGVHPGNRKTYAHSLVVDPWGEVMVDGGESEGVLMAELDLERVAQMRAKLPSLSHDRDYSFEN